LCLWTSSFAYLSNATTTRIQRAARTARSTSPRQGTASSVKHSFDATNMRIQRAARTAGSNSSRQRTASSVKHSFAALDGPHIDVTPVAVGPSCCLGHTLNLDPAATRAEVDAAEALGNVRGDEAVLI
jgi:hypothetical protein